MASYKAGISSTQGSSTYSISCKVCGTMWDLHVSLPNTITRAWQTNKYLVLFNNNYIIILKAIQHTVCGTMFELWDLLLLHSTMLWFTRCCGAICCQSNQEHQDEPLLFSLSALDSFACVYTTHGSNGFMSKTRYKYLYPHTTLIKLVVSRLTLSEQSNEVAVRVWFRTLSWVLSTYNMKRLRCW